MIQFSVFIIEGYCKSQQRSLLILSKGSFGRKRDRAAFAYSCRTAVIGSILDAFRAGM